jgi:hypothetical protein
VLYFIPTLAEALNQVGLADDADLNFFLMPLSPVKPDELWI